MKLSLGANLYYWPRQRTLDYYRAVADMPVDIVYLGETVCSRRHELRHGDWVGVAEELAAAGKEVLLASQSLIESESDLKALRKVVDNGRFMVEANDMGAARLLSRLNVPFVAGLSLNVFNSHTLDLLARLGARRWVMAPEMSQAVLGQMQAARPAGMQTEVLGYGRLPLAWSARCFTARHYNLQKDDCEFRCVDHADGLLVKTRDGDELLNLNGTQTQSARVFNLVLDLPGLRASGVDVLRLSPQSLDMGTIVAAFRAALSGELDGAAALARMRESMPGEPCNGFWHGRPGLDQMVSAA